MFISNPYLPYGVAAPRATTNTLVKSDTPLTIGQLKDALTRDLAEFVAKMDTAFPRGERQIDAKPSIVLFTNQADFFAA
jgi:hypothetical protein